MKAGAAMAANRMVAIASMPITYSHPIRILRILFSPLAVFFLKTLRGRAQRALRAPQAFTLATSNAPCQRLFYFS